MDNPTDYQTLLLVSLLTDSIDCWNEFAAQVFRLSYHPNHAECSLRSYPQESPWISLRLLLAIYALW